MRDKGKEIERIMKALANHRRLLILWYLKDKKEATVGEIAEHLKLSFKSTSRHLSVFSSADILDKKQIGLNVIYSFKEPKNFIVKTIL